MNVLLKFMLVTFSLRYLTSFHLINRSILCISNVELFMVALWVYVILCKIVKLKLHHGGRVFKHKLNLIEVAFLPKDWKVAHWSPPDKKAQKQNSQEKYILPPTLYSLKIVKNIKNNRKGDFEKKRKWKSLKSFLYLINVIIRTLVMPWRGWYSYSETKILYWLWSMRASEKYRLSKQSLVLTARQDVNIWYWSRAF